MTSMSPLRTKFYDLLDSGKLASSKTRLSARETAQEYQSELALVQRIKDLDGSSADLDTREHYVRTESRGDGLFPPHSQEAMAYEAAGQTKYQYTSSTQLSLPAVNDEPIALATSVDGYSNPHDGSWTVHRLTELPGSVTLASLHLHPSNPIESYKEEWFLKA